MGEYDRIIPFFLLTATAAIGIESIRPVNGRRTRACDATAEAGEPVVTEPYDREKVIRDSAVKFD